VKLARFERPKATCFLSYIEYRPNTNTAILFKKTGNTNERSYVTGQGLKKVVKLHMGDE
jgi:hypothetical protein